MYLPKCLLTISGIFALQQPDNAISIFDCSTKMFLRNSKTMFFHSPINMHQRVGACALGAYVCSCVCVCSVFYFKKQSFMSTSRLRMCVRVRACARNAPTGMNYLEKSLLYLSTVDWPQAHTVLLPTTQETTLIHHSSSCSMPPSHPTTPTQLFPSMLWWSPTDAPSSQPCFVGPSKTERKKCREGDREVDKVKDEERST